MTPQIAQFQAGTQVTPASINPPFKGPALRDCTQGELGIEQKEHFGEDFNKDLEFLKKDINTLQNDPKVSHFVEDVKRREAIDTDKIDKDFLEALKGLVADENVKFGERDGLTAPEANIPIVQFNQNESSSKTMITDSVLIPGNGKPAQNQGQRDDSFGSMVTPLKLDVQTPTQPTAINQQPEKTWNTSRLGQTDQAAKVNTSTQQYPHVNQDIGILNPVNYTPVKAEPSHKAPTNVAVNTAHTTIGQAQVNDVELVRLLRRVGI